MTKQEAIIFFESQLEDVSQSFPSDYERDAQEAYQLAIKAIKKQKDTHNSGYWIFVKNLVWDHDLYKCSNCEVEMPDSNYYNFCPYCGTKMEEK